MSDISIAEVNDIKYKFLFIAIIPFLTICAGLYHIGYWSTFDINILQYLDISDLIKSFIYPFISSVIVYFLGYIIEAFLFPKTSALWRTFNVITEDEYKSKPFRIRRAIGYIISTLFCLWSIIYGGNEKWFLIPFFLSIVVGNILNSRQFLSSMIPDINLRANLVYTIFLIPFLSFGFGKGESMKMLGNDTSKATYVTVAQLPVKHKFIGIAGDYIFLLSDDNKQIVMLLKSNVEKITIQRSQIVSPE